MRITFASIPGFGHIYPLMPLAVACQEAGHDVQLAVGEQFLGRLPVPTIRGVPAELTMDAAWSETRRRHPDLHGPEASFAAFGDVAAEAVSALLTPLFVADPPDIVVYEAMNTGAAIAASIVRVPAVGFNIGMTPALVGVMSERTLRYRSADWAAAGTTRPAALAIAAINPVPPTVSAVPFPASLGSAGPPIPEIAIRSVPYSEGLGTVPDWLLQSHTRPRVYITLGTVAFGAVEVLSRAVREVSRLDVDVLVAVGPEGDPSALGEFGANVHLERFVDQAAIWPYVDLAVHHGGTGTVLGALAHGIPQLILPQGADQFLNAALLPSLGVGLAQRNDDYRPGSIAEIATVLLNESDQATRARAIRDEMNSMPTPAEVVPALIRLADAR
jgi:UDP:flavonoid glycosyltransferase YjiC (YdhE family)